MFEVRNTQRVSCLLSCRSFPFLRIAAPPPLTRTKKKRFHISQAKVAEWQALSASTEEIKAEAARLEAQNLKLGDELDRLAPTASPAKGKKAAAAAAAELAAAIKA